MVSSTKCLMALGLLVSIGCCDGARILAAFPTPSRSHVISFEALTKALASKGHQLTVISSFPLGQPMANYTDIYVPSTVHEAMNINMFERTNQSTFATFISGFNFFMNFGTIICKQYLEDPGVQKLIESKDQYDLLITEVFFSECFLGFAHKFNVPVVGVVPMGGLNWMMDFMGNPSPHSYVPNIILGFSDHMTFFERLQNTLASTMNSLVRRVLILPKQDALMKQYFNASAPLPYIEDIERNMSLLLLNTHVSFGYPRPLSPNVLEVGGMHIKAGQKLPQDLKKYLDESKDGVIYFSMGSNLKGADLPETQRNAFLEAFSKMKHRVLWKWEQDTIPGKPDNVRLGKWLPQSAILEHPNVRVFMTHGGLLSTQEAVYHGMPVVGVPVFGDQVMNMKLAEKAGYGVMLEFNNVTAQSVQWALQTVIDTPSYRQRVKDMSVRFHDQPRTPLETAVFWTEYVLRHDGAKHMRSAALDLAWYQYYFLDVIGILALALLAVVAVVYLVVKMLARLVCGGEEKVRKTLPQQSRENKKRN